MVLEPPDDRKQSAQLLKVKRRRGEEVLQALLYQDGETHAFYQLAGQEPHLPAGPIDKGPECAADIVKELQALGKRRKVMAVVVAAQMETVSLNDSVDPDFCYDYYVARRMESANLSLLDPSTIGQVFFEDQLVFASDEDDQHSLCAADGDQDSNAEDYYLNDYPDESDHFSGSSDGEFDGSDHEDTYSS